MISTLVIGLGGIGCRVVTQMKKRMEQSNVPLHRHKFILLDRDGLALSTACHDSGIPGVHLRLSGNCGQHVLKNPEREAIRQWYPDGPFWFDATEGTAQHRVLGRLAFLEAMKQGLGRRLEHMIAPLLLEEGFEKGVRIVIVTSLCGGTGSGCFIQLALLLRDLLYRYWNIEPQICGFFAGPEILRWDARSFSQMLILRANAHGALRELCWLTRLRLQAIRAEHRICLDGLMDTDVSVPLKNRIIYNQVYLYNASKSANQQQINGATHIAKMAESLYYRYGSTMTPTVDQVQKNKSQWKLGIRVYVPLDEDVDRNREIYMQPDCGVAIENLPLAASVRFTSAYIRLCKRAMEGEEPGPHMDKRWPAWLLELW